MEAGGLRQQTEDSVTLLTLLRPERRNPLTETLRLKLQEALEAACRANSKVLVLRSAPATPATFAAGADLADIEALHAAEAMAFAERGQALFRAFEDAPFLTLAAVDGPCLGGALDLALSCDGILCTERASFGHPGARLGIVTGWGGTRRLPRAIGPAAAAGLFTSGRRLSAGEATRLGLVWECLPTEDFDGECARRAASWARGLESVPGWELGAAKRVLAAQPDARHDLDTAFSRLLGVGRERSP